MAEAISDAQVRRALRPFVVASRPVLDALREADPFGLRGRVVEHREGSSRWDRLLDRLAAVQLPGTAAWAGMDVAERSDWWLRRVGAFTALLAALPGIGGALAERLPVQDALGAAGQGLVLCALAGEHGMRDTDEQVGMLAGVLFGRSLEPGPHPVEASDADRQAAEIIGELRAARGRPGPAAVGRTVWRLGRVLWSLGDELGRRPKGRLPHRLLSKLPVVGIVGAYLGERSALRRAARAGTGWIERSQAGTR